MKKLFAASVVAAVACAAAVFAQAPAPPPMASAPAGCLKSTREYRQVLMKDVQARLKESGRQVTQEDVNTVGARTAEYASACAAQFAKGGVPAADMPALAELQVEAQQIDAAKQTIASALAAAWRRRRREGRHALDGRAHPLEADPPARRAGPGRGLDGPNSRSCPPSFVRERIEAHGVLNGYYRADDIDAGIIKHSTRLIELNAGLHGRPAHASISNTMIAAYSNLAEALGRTGADGEGARPAAPRAGGACRASTGVAERLAPTIERYELVGRPAARRSRRRRG